LSPDSKAFAFNAEADGTYWFNVAVVDQQGKQIPADLSGTTPALKVRVLTTR
jgi:hypothetical protein